MAEITLNELAEIVNKPLNTVKQAAKRKSIERSGRGKLDTTHPTNIAYLNKWAPGYLSPEPAQSDPEPPPKKPKPSDTKQGKTILKQIENELQDETAERDLSQMGEQALKEELIRKKIIQADQDLAYKIQQTALSETRRKKMEAELIETTWVIKTLGHDMAIYRKETESAITTLLKTVIAEQGIAGEDKEKYYKMLTDMLDKSFKKHGSELKKKVNTYSPAKILEGGEV